MIAFNWQSQVGGGFVGKVIFELSPKDWQTWGKLGMEKW